MYSTQKQKLCTSSSGLPKWQQSPIDISHVAVWNKKFPPLLLTNYWSNNGTAILANTGKTGSFHVRYKFETYRIHIYDLIISSYHRVGG